MYTQLTNYKQWYDGDISVSSNDYLSFLLKGNFTDLVKIYVDDMSPEIDNYNKLQPNNSKIQIKKDVDVNRITNDWIIPTEWSQLNVEQYSFQLLEKELINTSLSKQEQQLRLDRVVKELSLFKEKQLFDMLKVIFYVINTFERENIVWGVGRGSSVSSYILYLAKVHDIDSVLYDLPLEDFIS